MEEGYIIPDPSDSECSIYKTKVDYLKNHLLTATIESNASSFINSKTMDGLQM